MATIVQASRNVGIASTTLDTPTTAHNTLIVIFCASSGGSGTPAVTGMTLGGSADHFAAQVTQSQGTQSYALATVWMDRDCAGGQTAVAVTGSNLTASSQLIWVLEVAGLGANPALDKSSTGPLGAGTQTWTSNASGTTTAGGGITVGATAHGPYSAGDSLGGPASPWTNCAQWQWAGGANIAGYQLPAGTGTYTYNGTSTGYDYYTAVVAYFRPDTASANASPAAADGAGTGEGPAASSSLAALPDPADGTSGAGDAASSASFTVTAGTADGVTAADGTYATVPAGGRITAPVAEAAGTGEDSGLTVTGTALAFPAAAAGAGGGTDGAASATVTRAPAQAEGAGSAAAAVPAVTVGPAPGQAEAGGQALAAVVLSVGYGQVVPATAAASGDAPAPSIFAYAQPVYLGASGGTGRPLPLPGGSQVSVTPPGGGQAVFLSCLGHVQDLTYSFVMPGGADKLTCTLKLPASLRSGILTAGWHVRVHRGGHTCWTGRLDEPQPGPGGWTITAVGDGQRGNDFAAIYSGSWPSGQPDDLVNQAIARGLNWASPGVGQPSWLWTGQRPDPGSATVAAVLTQLCSRGGGTWYVDSQPDGRPRLSLLPVPDDVDRLLLVTDPVSRTLAPLVNRLVIRYQSSADNTDTGAAAAYGLTTVTAAADVTVHDVTESYLDLSSAGVMTAAAAQAAGNSLLGLYRAAAYAGPFTAAPGQLLTAGGVPVDPGCDQAGHVIRLVISDFGYGGEVTPAVPVVFLSGGYSWDDQHGIATITPYQTRESSLSGLAGALTQP